MNEKSWIMFDGKHNRYEYSDFFLAIEELQNAVKGVDGTERIEFYVNDGVSLHLVYSNGVAG